MTAPTSPIVPSPPPPPPTKVAPPRRQPKRVNAVPIAAGGVLAMSLIAFAAWIVVHHPNSEVHGADPNINLASARPGIDLSSIPQLTTPPITAPAEIPKLQPAVLDQPATVTPQRVGPRKPEPGMTEVEVQARRHAWEDYYRSLADAETTRRGTLLAALQSDTTTTPVPRRSQQAGSSGRPGAGGGGAGPGSALAGLPGAPGAGDGGSSAPAGPSSPSNPLADVYGSAAADPAAAHYIPTQLTQPLYDLEIKQGDIIPCNTTREMLNELPGQVKLQVSTAVTDHRTHTHVLIPAGSTILGAYSNDQHYGDERMPMGVSRIIFPDSQSLDIGIQPVSDAAGAVGLSDKVDRHTGRIIFNAVLNGVFGVSTALAQQAVGGAVGGGIVTAASQAQPRVVEAKPTLRIRPGFACSIEMTGDIGFDHEWEPPADEPAGPAFYYPTSAHR